MTVLKGDMPKIAKNVRRLRALAGISQVELAKRSGWKVWDVQKLERGEITPYVNDLKRIARSLNVDWSELTATTVPALPLFSQ